MPRWYLRRVSGLAVGLLIALSAVTLWHIREAWLSLYPLLGGVQPALPPPTILALRLSAALPLTLLATTAALLSVPGRTTPHPPRQLVSGFTWFIFFLFLNWALALPFMGVESVP